MAKWSSKKIIELLRLQRHPNDRGEWATFTEVRNGTGFQKQERYMDLFAIACWPSKGFRTVAYEVKVDRADFMREILDPTKRANPEKVAGECWFATPAGLVTKDEVPEGWGLVTCTEDGVLKTMKMPLQRTPAPWDMTFIASLLRKASEPVSEIPLPLWKAAGKDLTLEELKELFYEKMEDIKHEASIEATKAMDEMYAATIESLQDKLKEATSLKKEVAKVVGMTPYEIHNATNAQLIRRIEGTIARIEISPELLKLLYSAKTSLDVVLDKADKAKLTQ